MTDPIADFLTRIRNASAAGKAEARMPHARMLEHIAALLTREGFLEEFSTRGRGTRKTLVVRLRYLEGKPVVEDLRRVSRPGRRVYRSAAEIRSVKSGFGVAIFSTPEGLLTNREAKKRNVGGEVICEVW